MSNKALILTLYKAKFIKALCLCLALFCFVGGGIYFGRTALLHFYLERLGLLSNGTSFTLLFPEKVPHSGPVEKLLGHILFLFPWELEGNIRHKTEGLIPFRISTYRDRGSLKLKTDHWSLNADWRGKKRWLSFEKTPLTLISSMPSGYLDGGWKSTGNFHAGDVTLSLASGGTFSLSGKGHKVALSSPLFILEGKLDFDLPIGAAPRLTLSEGHGKIDAASLEILLKGVSFDSATRAVEGFIEQKTPYAPIDGIKLLNGVGGFTFDLGAERFTGRDFEGVLSLFGEDKKVLFPFWEADHEGGAFESWIQGEGLVKGILTKESIHIFEGSSIGGIDVGPLKMTSKQIEGNLRSDLGSLIKKWGAWNQFSLPPLPPIEGIFDGEFVVNEKGGKCRLAGRDLSIKGFPVSSASFDLAFDPSRVTLKEGYLEEAALHFEVEKSEKGWEMPYFRLNWRDFLKIAALGSGKNESAHFQVETFKADIGLFESIPDIQKFLHQYDLKGILIGSGEGDFTDSNFRVIFNVKPDEVMAQDKKIPFLEETRVEVQHEYIVMSGGKCLIDGHLLTLTSGKIDENGLILEGEGSFSLPFLPGGSLKGPWSYRREIFSGQAELAPFGSILWQKGFESSLLLKAHDHEFSMEIDDRGGAKGRWRDEVSFEISLKAEGKGEGKARFLGLSIPDVTLESPLPLEVAWVFPSTGILPFRLIPEGIEIISGGELFSEGKGIRYEKIEGTVGFGGDLNLRLLPKASRLPLYWLERGEIIVRGSFLEPKLEVKWR